MTVFEQLALIVEPEIEPTATLAERFEAFHEANPRVYSTLVNLALSWHERTGGRRLGIAALWERMRWEIGVNTTESPKLNNDYRAFYARLIMHDEPRLTGMFELRRSIADESVSVDLGASIE